MGLFRGVSVVVVEKRVQGTILFLISCYRWIFVFRLCLSVKVSFLSEYVAVSQHITKSCMVKTQQIRLKRVCYCWLEAVL